MYRVSISNGLIFEANPGEILLDAAARNGVFLPYSCRIGRCSTCKAKLIKGSCEAVKSQFELTPAEEKAGFILTCCQTPTSDLTIDAHALAIPPKPKVTLPCKIQTLERSDSIAQLTVRLPPQQIFDYYPGQYVTLSRGNISRAYSIANAPRADNTLEFFLRRNPGGELSQYWFETAKPGDLLKLEGPLGTFLAQPTSKKYVVFLATGTGIAPVRAILENMPTEFADKTVAIYWGNRQMESLHHLQSIQKLPGRFIPIMSRASSDWMGRRGYVQQAACEDGIPFEDAVVYACGSETMIRSARQVLVDQGLSPVDFFADAFIPTL